MIFFPSVGISNELITKIGYVLGKNSLIDSIIAEKNRINKGTFVLGIKKLLVEYSWIKHLKFSLYRMLTT